MTTVTRAERLAGVVERRTFTLGDAEIRSDGGLLKFDGYASLFDTPYDMYGGPNKGGWIEQVDRRAFDRTLSGGADVVLLINHEGMPLARTSSGTLELSTDRVGLRARAQLDTRDPDVQSLAVKMERGDMNEMSFAFRTVRQEWNDEESQRSLLELNLDKGDVSVVNNGANPKTSSTLRSITDAIELLGVDAWQSEALAEARADLDVDALAAAHETLGRLLRDARPADRRRLTVAQAKRLMLLTA